MLKNNLKMFLMKQMIKYYLSLVEKIPLTNIRKTIALRLQQSKQTVPHFYLKTKVSVKKIINARKTFNFSQENLDSKINISLMI